ncbi:helix-turn-helix domain-containing protein [Kurthia senegalensis]|uniref:helix-turn-helix domain-containing protein n=1 Tax=Kurthia senegalensis TaxID=1033740 RepID=UPI000289FA44|nr:helix-turn-helix transcriptional regulator [Kurthia senegalensis]
MAIYIRLNYLLAAKNMTSKQLAEKLQMTEANVSRLKTNQTQTIRFSTIDALCDIFDCQPGDLFEYVPDEALDSTRSKC